MRDSTGAFVEAPASWLSSLGLCCAPFITRREEKQGRSKSSFTTVAWPLGRKTSDQALLIDEDEEKQRVAVVQDQPDALARPVALPGPASSPTPSRDRLPRKSFTSGRTSFSARSRFWSDSPSRRPHISAPSDFRHLNTSSFQFAVDSEEPPLPQRARTASPGSFRPLELRICTPNNEISPILPHFGVRDNVPSPPPAYVRDSCDEQHRLTRQRSYTSMSFHIPRKHIIDGSPGSSQGELPPMIPPRAPGRTRAYTAPEVETIKERVASAMIEMELLQQQIDDVIERQSLYVASRPSSAHSMARTVPEMEPMPSIPALPPAAPSFAERLNSDMERPQTAPLKYPILSTSGSKSNGQENSTPTSHVSTRRSNGPLPPPLPLVLRPPLRKKKSFSRVSTWLFPGPEHGRNLSFDTVTNLPRPVKGRDGFYQCLSSNIEDQDRQSFEESIHSASTWETDDGERTVPTTWSLRSTPAVKQEEPPLIERSSTFGSTGKRPGMVPRVGVAI